MKWEIVPFAKKKKNEENRITGGLIEQKKTFQTTTMGNGIRNELKIDN